MENEKIIDKYYQEAVKGLNEIVFQDKDLWYSYVIHLDSNVQVVYNVIVFHQQVLNGGLHQYFFNSYGQFAYLTVENLKLIKAFKTAEILESALSEVNIEHDDIDKFRENIFNRKNSRIVDFDNQLFDYLNDLDSKYYSLDEDIKKLLLNYLKS